MYVCSMYIFPFFLITNDFVLKLQFRSVDDLSRGVIAMKAEHSVARVESKVYNSNNNIHDLSLLNISGRADLLEHCSLSRAQAFVRCHLARLHAQHALVPEAIERRVGA